MQIRVDVSMEMEVSGDRRKGDIPSPERRVKPLLCNSKFLSDQVMKGGTYKFKKILAAQREETGQWRSLCEWRDFDFSHKNWELAHSFVHGYMKGFIDFREKRPEMGVLLTNHLSKADRQVEDDRKRPVVNRDPAFYGPHSLHSRIDPPMPPPAVKAARLPNEDRALSLLLIYSAQAVRVPDQTGWWSHAFVLSLMEGGISRLESPVPYFGSQLSSPGCHGTRR